MAFRLTKGYPRLWSLDAGVAVVVTDLHGDWDAYARSASASSSCTQPGRPTA